MRYLTLTTMLVISFATPAYAQQQAADHAAHPVAQVKSDVALTDGEVRRVDKAAKKLTIRHGPISNLDMPAMTMVYQVKDSAMLNKVNAGDKIKFSAEKTGATYIVTRVETAKVKY